ncbi:MAG: mannonate dehydratase [Lachnospiraceae bacterium]|nr:mannonate dehydratase [Lachnospiraceae bacterium]
MEMTFRWFGKELDTIPVKYIAQIPGVKGVVTTICNKKPGALWTREEIKALKADVSEAGLKISGIESVNVHDDIKAGTGERDLYIENYIRTLEALGEEDIHMVCYNFMPVFDWTRTDLARQLPDGSTAMAYEDEVVRSTDPEKMFDSIKNSANGTIMPGWEPERVTEIRKLFDLYENISGEDLFNNLVYFVTAVMPVCNKYDIKMAIHPDDPAHSVFGLPRILTDKKRILRLMEAVDDVHNGVTLCTGALGSDRSNDIPDIIRSLKGRIHFAHIRNIKYGDGRDFREASHLSQDGSFDMYEIVKTLIDTGFDGVVRPDHGRMIWGEKSIPGYGLYDRALGATYINGLWEAVTKGKRQ